MSQSVYIIGPHRRGPVKIGIARDPGKRLATFQTAHWMRLHLFAVVRSRDAFALEQAAHKHLSPLHLNGEWFDVGVEEAKTALRIRSGRTRFGIFSWLRRIGLRLRLRNGSRRRSALSFQRKRVR